MVSADITTQNQRELRKLIVSVEANAQSLGLLLAICDDRNLQDQLINTYEAELQSQGITAFRVRLDLKKPSLRAALETLVAREPDLRAGKPAVVTVLNAGELLGVRLTDSKSEQERFFFSLQWTREALRRFEFPVVIWLPDAVATRLGQRAPDFWSWRAGVFEFEAMSSLAYNISESPSQVVKSPQAVYEMNDISKISHLAISDLRNQVNEFEKTSPESSLLITLYNALGEAYEREYAYDKALAQYEKALALAKAKNNFAGQVRSLRNLGNSLRYSGRSQQAIEFYEQSIEIASEIGDYQGEANSLGDLGNAYYLLGQYQRAIDFHKKSLEIKRKTGDRSGEAASLGNLGIAYGSLGQYQRAIDFHQQSLYVAREIGDRRGEANSLGNLGNAYESLGQYQRAIDLHQQSLEIKHEIGDRRGEANSLGNLGNAFRLLGQYQLAVDFHQKSLEIKRDIGDRRGEAASLGNLGIAYDSLGQYQRAIHFYQQQLDITCAIGDRRGAAHAYFNRSCALARLNQKTEACASFEAARALFRDLGLQKDVEDCDLAIRELGQIVALPRQARQIASSSEPHRRKRLPINVWFLAVLILALLLWWLL